MGGRVSSIESTSFSSNLARNVSFVAIHIHWLRAATTAATLADRNNNTNRGTVTFSPEVFFFVGPEELDDQALHDLGGVAQELVLVHLRIAPLHRVPRVGLALETPDRHSRDHRQRSEDGKHERLGCDVVTVDDDRGGQ